MRAPVPVKEGRAVLRAPGPEMRGQGAPGSHVGITECLPSTPPPQSVQGTGLAFIAFTEAMTHFPASPFWSVMFFLMLINLGLGSMIGTMAGITTPIIDTFKVPKEMFTGKASWPPPLPRWPCGLPSGTTVRTCL